MIILDLVVLNEVLSWIKEINSDNRHLLVMLGESLSNRDYGLFNEINDSLKSNFSKADILHNFANKHLDRYDNAR